MDRKNIVKGGGKTGDGSKDAFMKISKAVVGRVISGKIHFSSFFYSFKTLELACACILGTQRWITSV
ncbi:MAG: hypothetical protein Q6373_011410 [Candidatus Sigynarchaeota archaeon]